ncbi:hypothetical protein PMIN05_004941 [Paraphaeosphaeria minitans]
MGCSIGSSDDLSGIEEFVEDAMYYVRRFSAATKAERRKQTFQHLLRKLRLRKCRHRKWQGILVNAPQHPLDTELNRYLSEIQPPLRPQNSISVHWWESIAITWKFQAFKEDVGMRAFFAEEQKNAKMPLKGTGLFVQEFQNSPDALDTRIHRVFRPSSWQNPILQPRLTEGRKHQAWVNMRPALILATQFLLDPRLGAFWYHLMYGTPVTDAASRKTYLEHSNLEDDLQTTRADFAALLDNLADRVTFYWRPENSKEPTVVGITQSSFWDILDDFIDTSRLDHLRKPEESFNSFIGLSSKFLYNLMSVTAVTHTDMNADIRFQFLLAVTITHEIAHTIYGWRGLPHIGWSWENHIWDGIILTCTINYDTIGKVRARTWESEVLKETHIYTPVAEDWLKSLFMKNTWKTIDQTIKKIPRPVGSPRLFVAQRWFNSQRGFEFVEYVKGLAVKPEHQLLNDREGPVKGDVDAWFKRVRKIDLQKAVQSGQFVKRPKLGPRSEVLGHAIAWAPIDEDMTDAEEVDHEDADEDAEDSIEYESSDDDFLNGEDPPKEYEMDFPMVLPPTFRHPGGIPVAQHRLLPTDPSPDDLGFARGIIPPDRVHR